MLAKIQLRERKKTNKQTNKQNNKNKNKTKDDKNINKTKQTNTVSLFLAERGGETQFANRNALKSLGLGGETDLCASTSMSFLEDEITLIRDPILMPFADRGRLTVV